MKSNLTAAPYAKLPILIGSAALALSKNKKRVVNWTTPRSPVRSLISGNPSTQVYTTQQNLQCFVIYSCIWNELVGRSSMDGFFPTTPKNTEIDQNGLWWHLTFDLRLTLSFLRRILTAGETDKRHWHDWHSRHTCTCVIPSHSWPVM